MKPSDVVYCNQLSEIKNYIKKDSILLFDEKLLHEAKLAQDLNKFRKLFSLSIGLKAGEDLKRIFHFEKLVQFLADNWNSRRPDSQLFVLGGGSLGDFAGFVASTYKRGVPFCVIPSTWLSALDSAHGGKTALNLSEFKNQIGTFYPAQTVFVVKMILKNEPEDRLRDALGEVFKTALLDVKTWKLLSHVDEITFDILWGILPRLIAFKWKVVKSDPFESKKIRHCLNYGHTIGHAIELNLSWTHGKSVFYGIIFELIFGRFRNQISNQNFEAILSSVFIRKLFNFQEYQRFLSLRERDVLSSLTKDKKISKKKNELYMTRLSKPGNYRQESVPIEIVLSEFKRQKKKFNYAKKLF